MGQTEGYASDAGPVPRPFNERTSIVIGLPMTTAAYNETNPFAIKFQGPKEKVSYVLAHQPKSFDWRARNAKAHSQTPRRSARACCWRSIFLLATPLCALTGQSQAAASGPQERN
ncbi:protein PemK (plasmid) [Cupriavidus necator N-1]|uniref:Protein PemK n=2 Tax=Cupriavidus necator TaxID=106590 RepID=F8GVV9_CUPNN|nr:protein PemK [Cupriavidus necator N-1]